MAALPVLTPASPPAPGSGSPLTLAVGLLALIAGGALLLCGLLLPISPSHPSDVPRSAVNRAANMRFDGGRDVPKVTKAPSLRFTAMTQSDIDDRFRLATTLAPPPVCQDPRDALAAMAPRHYRAPWTHWDGTGAAAAQAAGAVPTPQAAPVAAETVLRVEPMGPPQEGRSRVYSRIAMRPHARWEVDIDGGPLSLFVQHGRVGLVLDGDSAHVEVDDLLFGKRSDPVSPGSRVVLWPGDRLVVSRGRHLCVDNNDATLAIISVSRLEHAPPSASVESE